MKNSKPFGAMYRCSKGRKGHYFAAYFFDSKPEETLCVRYPCFENGTMAIKVEELDLTQGSEKALKTRRKAKETSVTDQGCDSGIKEG